MLGWVGTQPAALSKTCQWRLCDRHWLVDSEPECATSLCVFKFKLGPGCHCLCQCHCR